MKRVFYLLPLAIFLVIVGYFATSLRPGHDSHELPSAMIEKPAPSFDLATLDLTGQDLTGKDLTGKGNSKPLTLDSLKGHPFVINFFASWCVPCRIEHPVLMRLATENHIPLYGIAYKDKPADSARHGPGRPGRPEFWRLWRAGNLCRR
jgi:cytochrome c biogenesis protein CcmG/thiol:disulfide interchange protein DsbE